MFKRLFVLPLAASLALSLTIGLFAPAASAATLAEAQKEFDAFMKGADHRFAPATAEKAQAFLGAAMLAERGKDQQGLADGIEQALAMLREASGTADNFRKMFPELIRLMESTESTFRAVGSFNPRKEPNPRFLQSSAEKRLDATVGFFESGDLNNARQAADQAIADYRAALDAALPALIDVAGDTFSKAISAGAKSYAPQSYEAAKKELDTVQRYIDGATRQAPERPERALQYAEQLLTITNQIKLLRKESGSHEGMILKSRQDRLAMAEALGIPYDAADPNSDVSSATLIKAMKQMKAELAQERAGRASDRARLEAEFNDKLKADIEAQRDRLLAEQGEKVSSLKEAFRAKLEKETFEQKRQEQVHKLFKKGEVEILANVDGSLLIRLTALKFASGSSKIGAANYDLLGRLKKALEIYGERTANIEGHTDSKGDVKLNQAISLKRAEAVRDFLIAAGTDGSRLKALGYGEVRPIASNDFEKGRAMNRRIDVVIAAPQR